MAAISENNQPGRTRNSTGPKFLNGDPIPSYAHAQTGDVMEAEAKEASTYYRLHMRLRDAIQFLGGELDVLEAKLQPVIVSSPRLDSASNAQDPPEPCDFERRMDGAIRSLNEQTERIARLHGDCIL